MNGGEYEQEPGGELPPTVPAGEDLLGRAFPGEMQNGRPAPSEQPEEREADEEQPAPRIYVASLSDYNAGRLHGRWIDANQPLDDVWSDIGDMLAESPEPGAEEWAIHDFEGFWPLEFHEYESVEFVQQVAAGITQHGEAFAAFAGGVADRDPERFAFFGELYKGKWESVEDYARSVMEQDGVATLLGQLPAWVHPHVSIDYDALVEDMRAAGVTSVEARDGGVYVFDFE